MKTLLGTMKWQTISVLVILGIVLVGLTFYMGHVYGNQLPFLSAEVKEEELVAKEKETPIFYIIEAKRVVDDEYSGFNKPDGAGEFKRILSTPEYTEVFDQMVSEDGRYIYFILKSELRFSNRLADFLVGYQ